MFHVNLFEIRVENSLGIWSCNHLADPAMEFNNFHYTVKSKVYLIYF